MTEQRWREIMTEEDYTDQDQDEIWAAKPEGEYLDGMDNPEERTRFAARAAKPLFPDSRTPNALTPLTREIFDAHCKMRRVKPEYMDLLWNNKPEGGSVLALSILLDLLRSISSTGSELFDFFEKGGEEKNARTYLQSAGEV